MEHRRLLLAFFVLLGSPGCEPSGTTHGECGAGFEFAVTKNEVSSRIPTVGVVEWSWAGGTPESAKIVYELKSAASSVLNQGGEAPVKLGKSNFRTLLLGLKQSRDYTFHIEASRGERTCRSQDYALPTTGSFAGARPVTVQVAQAGKREPGFIVTSSGMSLPDSAFIVDADGEVVWYFPGPENTSRAQMDYEGENMWMVSANAINQGGEVRFVSMDGEQEVLDVPGLENAHHDLTVMPEGKVAALVWRTTPLIEPESDLVIRSSDGQLTVPFKIGSNLYQSDTYHANAVHYLPVDDSFTIADRNANVFVKVSATGSPGWQLGGRCDNAPAGNRCSPQDWQVTHGHHLLEDGTFVAFSNGYEDVAHVFEFRLDTTPTSLSATLVRDYPGTAGSINLGDVQRLPGGNTLVTYSADGKIVELDASWNEVQTLAGRFGYSSWRPTLYGPPLRL